MQLKCAEAIAEIPLYGWSIMEVAQNAAGRHAVTSIEAESVMIQRASRSKKGADDSTG